MKKADSFDHKAVEKKWQAKWSSSKVYQPDLGKSTKKFYNLMMFPYPSAEGLHAGNMFAFTGSDVYGRFKRMQGNDVFEPIGLDGFGIHSENYALKIGKHPMDQAKIAEAHYYDQLHEIGAGFAWDNKLETYDPDYYRWTQWLFIKLFKAGLAYKKKSPVNWCPSCKTVLADEQIMTPQQAAKIPVGYKSMDEVPEGIKICERCGSVPEKRDLDQWFFKITDYADRLLENLDKIDWSEKIKIAQKNWIGKKEGINITYDVVGSDKKITVFTTTPVNFGATFLVVAPEYAREHLLEVIPKSNKNSVSKYIKQSLDKPGGEQNKTGVFSGLKVVNHVTNETIPVWVSDFVLTEVGTGAVQGCPGHDKRDFEFAMKFKIPIKRVVVGEDGDVSEIDTLEKVIEKGTKGKMVNSDFLDGVSFSEAMQKTMDYFEEKGWGKRVTSYHLRDWLISRQRYWGPPIPMIYCEKDGWQPVPEEDLPVLLPRIDDYQPIGTGVGPLASHKEFYEVKCPSCGQMAKRETDVSDTFLDSAWYFLRYPSTDTKNEPWSTEIIKRWLPVDQYFGGAEHAVLHLMYARFITMFLYDQKLLSFEEPFPKFYAHGLVIKDGAKMSKSRGNVVNPDEYIEKYGADTLRLYLMFMGPMDGYPDFRDTGIEGMRRFIERLWKLFNEKPSEKPNTAITTKMHQTIKKVTEDVSEFRYNTAIAAIMEFVNVIKEQKGASQAQLEVLVKLIAPFAPHLAEEVWDVFGNKYSIHTSNWPEYDKKYLEVEELTIIIQVNGKMRSSITVGKNATKEEIEKIAKEDNKVINWIKTGIVKTIYVPGKIVNFVTK